MRRSREINSMALMKTLSSGIYNGAHTRVPANIHSRLARAGARRHATGIYALNRRVPHFSRAGNRARPRRGQRI